MLAVQRNYRDNVGEMLSSFPPEPDDVIYPDLYKDPKLEKLKQRGGHLLLGLLFVVSGPIIFLISAMTNLNQLSRTFPFIGKILIKFPVMQDLISCSLVSDPGNLKLVFESKVLVGRFKLVLKLRHEK